MSAKVVVCLIVVICLVAIKPATAFYSDEYFEVVHVEEIEGDDGKITFKGEALNISEFQSVQPANVTITLRLQGAVLAIVSGSPDIYEHIQPGQICPFTIETDFEQGQYDEFIVRFAGYAGGPNPNTESLTGDLMLVEESLNFTTFGSDSTAVILGELYNNTNGILTNISLEFRLFKDEDCLVGIATPSPTINEAGSTTYQDVAPGSTIGFIAYSEVHLSKVERWEYSLRYDLVRLAPVPDEEPIAAPIAAPIATVIAETTWGKVKAIGRR